MCTIELNRQRINKKDDIYQNSWLDILVTKMCSRRKLNQFILIKKLFNFLTLFTFHLLTYCKMFACNAYHINSWFCGNFLKEAVCALLLKSFVMSVSARCIYRFVCTIALQTIHEIEILKKDLKPRRSKFLS